MPSVLIASDAQWVVDEVSAALTMPGLEIITVSTGAEVRTTVAGSAPDLAVLDLQIGAMGGMAVCLDLRLEESGGRIPHVPVLMLLDRRPDVFLARRSQAEGWLVKPLDPIRTRTAVTALLGGGTFHDPSHAPVATVVASGSSGNIDE